MSGRPGRPRRVRYVGGDKEERVEEEDDPRDQGPQEATGDQGVQRAIIIERSILRAAAVCLTALCVLGVVRTTDRVMDYNSAIKELQTNYDNMTLDRDQWKTSFENMTLDRDQWKAKYIACGGTVDIVIVLDGSNSIYPWASVTSFLHRLIETMDIGPANTQVSIIQYGVDPKVEFYLNSHSSRESLLVATATISHLGGLEANTFRAIDFARREAFQPAHGARPGATKVMVVVTDGTSHDDDVIKQCQEDSITRFGIAVLGDYYGINQDTSYMITEIKSIASAPSERYFFNVSDVKALVEIAGTLGDRIFCVRGLC